MADKDPAEAKQPAVNPFAARIQKAVGKARERAQEKEKTELDRIERWEALKAKTFRPLLERTAEWISSQGFLCYVDEGFGHAIILRLSDRPGSNEVQGKIDRSELRSLIFDMDEEDETIRVGGKRFTNMGDADIQAIVADFIEGTFEPGQTQT